MKKIKLTIIVALIVSAGMAQSKFKFVEAKPSTNIRIWSTKIVTVNDSSKGQVAYKDSSAWVIKDTTATLDVMLSILKFQGTQIHTLVMKNDSLNRLIKYRKRKIRSLAPLPNGQIPANNLEGER